MSIRFTKMHGLGNDFVVIDAIQQSIVPTPTWIRAIADRHTGVGCDQVLLLTHADSAQADFGFRIFNADGGEVFQCGNGARCLGLFAQRLTGRSHFKFATKYDVLKVTCAHKGEVEVEIPKPNFVPASLPCDLSHELPCKMEVVSVGNPHAVILVNDFPEINLNALGEQLNHHSAFPEGVNVGIVRVIARDRIDLQVYERGVGPTQACGSGACAAMAVLRKQDYVDTSVSVQQPGGSLKVTWDSSHAPILMRGPAVIVFDGEILD